MPLYSKMFGGEQLDSDNKEKSQRSLRKLGAQQLLKEARKKTREGEIEFASGAFTEA